MLCGVNINIHLVSRQADILHRTMREPSASTHSVALRTACHEVAPGENTLLLIHVK